MIGSTLFYLQRFSAVFLLFYTVWIAIFFLSNQPLEYNSWTFFTSQLEFLVLTTLAAFTLMTHAFIGLWTIGTDYLTSRTIGFLNLAIARYAGLIRVVYTLLFCLLGLFFASMILFIIWI